MSHVLPETQRFSIHSCLQLHGFVAQNDWTTDEVNAHNFELSIQLSSSLTAGGLFASMSESETYRFYEADGVTPVGFTQTPEPSSLALLLAALPVGYFVTRRRRAIASGRA